MFAPHNSQYSYWESGAWKNKPPGSFSEYITQSRAGTGGTIGAIGGGILGALAGGALTSFIGMPWLGAAIGGVAGGYAGQFLGGVVGGGITYAWDQAFGGDDPWKLEYSQPFVNTRLAATMRQSAMQTMMSDTQNYRQILGREAARFHR